MIKVLWLDDDFQDIHEDLSEDVKEKRIRMHQALDDASLFGLEIDAVPFFDVFLKKIKQYPQYQVVILDLKGLDRNDPSNNRIFKEAQRLLQSLPLMQYVYSGTRNDDPRLFYDLEDFEKSGGTIVSKNVDIPTFFQRIKNDLIIKQYQPYYKGNEYCRELISRGYLSPSAQILAAMNQIMQHFYERDRLYAPYNNMRIIMENMLDQLAKIGEIKLTETPVESNKRFSSRLRFLARDCEIKRISRDNKDVEYDFDKPVYPYEKCPKEIKIVMLFLGDVVNNWSHFLDEHPDYLREGEISTDYNVHIQAAAYESFLLVMKWYYGRRLAIKDAEKRQEEFRAKQVEHLNTIMGKPDINMEKPAGLKIIGKIKLDKKGNPIK